MLFGGWRNRWSRHERRSGRLCCPIPLTNRYGVGGFVLLFTHIVVAGVIEYGVLTHIKLWNTYLQENEYIEKIKFEKTLEVIEIIARKTIGEIKLSQNALN